MGYLGGSRILSSVSFFEKQREIVIQTQKRENKIKHEELTATQSIAKVLEEATGGFCLQILQREILTGDIWALYS